MTDTNIDASLLHEHIRTTALMRRMLAANIAGWESPIWPITTPNLAVQDPIPAAHAVQHGGSLAVRGLELADDMAVRRFEALIEAERTDVLDISDEVLWPMPRPSRELYVGSSYSMLKGVMPLPVLGRVRTLFADADQLLLPGPMVHARRRHGISAPVELVINDDVPMQVGQWRLVGLEGNDWEARDPEIPWDRSFVQDYLTVLGEAERYLVVPRWGHESRVGLLPWHAADVVLYPVSWLPDQLRLLHHGPGRGAEVHALEAQGEDVLEREGFLAVHALNMDAPGLQVVSAETLEDIIRPGLMSEGFESVLLQAGGSISRFDEDYRQVLLNSGPVAALVASYPAGALEDEKLSVEISTRAVFELGWGPLLLLLWESSGIDLGVDWGAYLESLQVIDRG